MLVPYPNGKLLNTRTKEIIDDPNARRERQMSVTKGQELDGTALKEKFGIYNKNFVSKEFILEYIVGNEIKDTFTKESFDNVSTVLFKFISNLQQGVRPTYSIFLSLGPNPKITTLVYNLFATAYEAGLNVSAYKMLSEIKLYGEDEEHINNDDIYLVACPTSPTVQEYSDLCTLLDIRDRQGLPTILVSLKGDVKAYRTSFNKTDEDRLDMVYLLHLESNQSNSINKMLSENIDYDFTQADKAEALARQTRTKQDVEDYKQIVRHDFTNISNEKAKSMQQILAERIREQKTSD